MTLAALRRASVFPCIRGPVLRNIMVPESHSLVDQGSQHPDSGPIRREVKKKRIEIALQRDRGKCRSLLSIAKALDPTQQKAFYTMGETEKRGHEKTLSPCRTPSGRKCNLCLRTHVSGTDRNKMVGLSRRFRTGLVWGRLEIEGLDAVGLVST